MSLGTTVNMKKNGLLLAYIANNIPGIHLQKLLKIIYLIDEHFMKMRGFPLTWLDYYAWSKGPVAPEVYDIKNGAFGEYVSAHRSAESKWVVNPVSDIPEIENDVAQMFSTSEFAEIGKLIKKYSPCTADELSDLTHLKDSLWSKVVAIHHIVFDKNNTRSEFQMDLRRLFSDSDSRIDTYDEARWSMELQNTISSNRNPKHKIQLQVVTPSERDEFRIPVYTPVIP